MKASFKIDNTEFVKAIKNVKITAEDMLNISGAGSAVVKSVQKMLVPVASAATKLSINDHYIIQTAEKIENDIGPETEYAPYLEYGTGEFAAKGDGRKGGWVYKGPYGFRFTLGMNPRPFVVPSGTGNNKSKTQDAISNAFGIFLRNKWPT